MFENGKGLTQRALVLVGPTLKTSNYSKTLKYNKQPYDVTQKNKGNKPTALCAPWVGYKNKQFFTKKTNKKQQP